MYERFTDRARRVMHLANQEARRFNHDYIGTEHILLGLIKEGTGVAAKVLQNLDVNFRKIRLELEKIIQAGPTPAPKGKLPQTPRTQKVIHYAIEEARSLNHNYVGTEHLLLGLLREEEDECVGAIVLVNLGLSLSVVRDQVLQLIGEHLLSPTSQAAPPQERAELASTIEVAVAVTRRLVDLLQAIKVEAVAAMELERAAKVNEQMDNLVRIQLWLEQELRRQWPDPPKPDPS